MLKISDKAQQSHLSPIRKFYPYALKAQANGVKIFHLNIGQPDIPTPKEYFEAIRNIDLATDAYAQSPGDVKLINAIVNYYNKLGVDIDGSNVLVTTGGSEALLLAYFCIINEGDKIIVPEPFYPNYHTIVKVVGGDITPLPTYAEDDYFYADPKRLKKVLTKNTKAILVTNPNNPTGTILNDRDMDVIIKFALDNDLYIISDEVYREICYTDDKLTSILKHKGLDEHLIVIDSVSKRFSACGSRIGALISRNKKIIENATKLCQGRLSVSTINQIGAERMYSTVDPNFFTTIRDEYKNRCQTVVDELRKIEGVKVSPPKGAFYIMASLPIDDAEDFQRFLLEKFNDANETVMFAPASNFYATPGRGKNEIRIAAVLNQADLKRAIEVLHKGLLAYKAAR